jgi:caa(3)-type oxidase subunit IV
VVLFFMHAWRSTHVTWLVAISGLFWLALLIGLTLTDLLSRNWPM